MPLLWLLTFICLFAPTWSLLDREATDVASQLSRRQQPNIVITGLTPGAVQPRLEIRELQQNEAQWNVFLLGLARFQATNQTNLTSYYQIAGIHGRPYIPWDNVGPASNLTFPGFCTHVSNIFLNWHRPYLALFEQTLYQHIIEAVEEFPYGRERRIFMKAAQTWRLPYWDWAITPSGSTAFPTSLSSPTVTVYVPGGTAVIPNPLYAYQFHPVSIPDFYYAPFALWNTTKRYPTSWATGATSQDNLLSPILANNQISFQDRLYNLFTYYNNYTEFGNEAWLRGAGVANADSIESIHDVIHSIVGYNGHMTYLDYSAFDPSFWLHHAMVDRCFALWQALYPNSYVEPMAAVMQTYSIPIGSIQDENSPLEPFYSDSNGTFWTAESARFTQIFGYTYPELVGNSNASTVKAAINTLYGSSAGSAGLSRRNVPDNEKRELPGRIGHIKASKILGEVINGKQRQYIANIISQKFALNGSYAMYLFMGAFSEDPTTWATSSNLVGTHAVFAALSLDAASNPQSKLRRRHDGGHNHGAPINVTGSIPLTSMLLAQVETGVLADMSPRTVEKYLIVNLQWRVAKFDGTVYPVDDTVGLDITVFSAEVEPAPSIYEFPRWSNFTKLPHFERGHKKLMQVRNNSC